MLDLLRERLECLIPRAQQFVLQGDITLGQAYHYSVMKRRRAPTPSLRDLAKHHTTAHADVVREIPHIKYPTNLDDLFTEMSYAPRLVVQYFTHGQLTLVQARFIMIRSLGKNKILEFAETNRSFAIPQNKTKADPRKPIRVRGDKPNFKRYR